MSLLRYLAQDVAQHARLTHGLSAAEFRDLAGLNRTTRLVCHGKRTRLREIALPTIARLRAECKALATAVIEEGVRPEGRRQTARKVGLDRVPCYQT